MQALSIGLGTEFCISKGKIPFSALVATFKNLLTALHAQQLLTAIKLMTFDTHLVTTFKLNSLWEDAFWTLLATCLYSQNITIFIVLKQ